MSVATCAVVNCPVHGADPETAIVRLTRGELEAVIIGTEASRLKPVLGPDRWEGGSERRAQAVQGAPRERLEPMSELGLSWQRTLDWCEQHPYPTRDEMENSEIGEALIGRDLDGLAEPNVWDRFVAGVRREVERHG